MKARFLIALVSMLLPVVCMAQTPDQMTPEEQEKKMYEFIQTNVEKYTGMLKLEYWQVFKLDSTMTHNTRRMDDEMRALRESKVSNADRYYEVRDKWDEATYQEIHRFLTPEQWEKYLRSGAKGEKKIRDKRMQKNK